MNKTKVLYIFIAIFILAVCSFCFAVDNESDISEFVDEEISGDIFEEDFIEDTLSGDDFVEDEFLSGEVDDSEIEFEFDFEKVLQYEDISADDWFYDSVEYVLARGFFNGVSDNEFAPQKNLTRGMLVTVLYRMSEANETEKSTFLDVDENMYYSIPIAWANKNEIVKGVGDNKFNPDANITRQDLVTILYRFASSQGIDTTLYDDTDLDYFIDKEDVSEYALDAMKWAVSQSIINGRNENQIVPKETATRAETATLIQRIDFLIFW